MITISDKIDEVIANNHINYHSPSQLLDVLANHVKSQTKFWIEVPHMTKEDPDPESCKGTFSVRVPLKHEGISLWAFETAGEMAAFSNVVR